MVKPIPYDTYPAMILFLALLGMYMKEVSLIITAIGILVLHFVLQSWNAEASWTFFAAVVAWMVLWNAYYYFFGKTSLESFETVDTRPCTVYFTQFQKECDEGMFQKDVKYLQYIRDIRIRALERSLKQRQDKLEALEDAVSIVQAAIPMTKSSNVRLQIWKDPYRSILAYLTLRIDGLLSQEQQKGSEQDMTIIRSLLAQKNNLPSRVQTIMQLTFANYTEYINPVTWQISTTKRDAMIQETRARLQQDIATKQSQIQEEQNSSAYVNTSAVIQEINASNGTKRCKNSYYGWFQPASSGNMNLHDPVLNATSSETILRGDPYAWAHCYQLNASQGEWARKQAYFENNKKTFPSISYADTPIPVGDGEGVGSNQFTGRFSFNSFDPADQMVCDDTLVTPDYPRIPNGLLAIKLDGSDNIYSMQCIKYRGGDTRYIDPGLTKNIKDVDNTLLRSIFYMDGLEFNLTRPKNAPITWTKSIQGFLFPNKQIRYDVFYLYYDNKCNRFYGNTDETGAVRKSYMGPAKVGDLMGYKSSEGSNKVYFSDAQIIDPEVMTYIFQSVPGFSQGQNGRTYSVTSGGPVNYMKNLQDHCRQMLDVTVVTLDTEILALNTKIAEKDVLVADYARQMKEKQESLATLTAAGQCTKSPNNRWCIQYQSDIAKLTRTMNYVLTNVTDPYSRSNLIKSKNSKITERDRLTRIAKEIQRFIDTMDTRTNTVSASQTLNSYVKGPITKFVKGYNPSYLSNNRTMYLRVIALGPTGAPAAFLHDPTTDAFSQQLSLLAHPTLQDILDENVDYEGDITFDESELQEWEEGDDSSSPAPATVDHFDVEKPYTVQLLDKGDTLLQTYTVYDRINIRDDPELYTKVTSLKINKGVMVTVYNGKIATTYTNSRKATTPLEIRLNSTMTGDRCGPGLCTNYVQQIAILPSST